MIDKNPKVSIVSPSYNQSKYLGKTIRSVLNQSYQNIEYIVIDGGSTDNSVDIIKNYANKLAYWQSKPDQGPADACNKGFQHATGDILGYLNSDDVLMPKAIETLVNAMTEKANVDVIYGDAFIIDERGEVQRKLISPSHFNPYLYSLGGWGIAQQATLWKHEIFELVGGFNRDNRTCWDGEFWVDAVLSGAKFKHVPQFLAGFRYHPDSISKSGRLESEYRRDRERIFQKVFGRPQTTYDRLVLGSVSRVLGYLMTPRKMFPYLGIEDRNLDTMLTIGVG